MRRSSRLRLTAGSRSMTPSGGRLGQAQADGSLPAAVAPWPPSVGRRDVRRPAIDGCGAAGAGAVGVRRGRATACSAYSGSGCSGRRPGQERLGPRRHDLAARRRPGDRPRAGYAGLRQSLGRAGCGERGGGAHARARRGRRVVLLGLGLLGRGVGLGGAPRRRRAAPCGAPRRSRGRAARRRARAGDRAARGARGSW